MKFKSMQFEKRAKQFKRSYSLYAVYLGRTTTGLGFGQGRIISLLLTVLTAMIFFLARSVMLAKERSAFYGFSKATSSPYFNK